MDENSYDSPKKRRWWLAQLRSALWLMVIKSRGWGSKECRDYRVVLLANGTLLFVAGIVGFCFSVFQNPAPPAPQPTLWSRVGEGLAVLAAFAAAGSLAIYFSRWQEAEDE